MTMKKILFALLIILSVQLKAQQDSIVSSTISLNAGRSMLGMFFDISGKEWSKGVNPVYQISYDLMIARKWSLGAAFSYQTAAYGYDGGYGKVTSNVTVTNVGIRLLYYYSFLEHSVAYCGFRLSYTDVAETHPKPNVVSNTNYPQIILLAIRTNWLSGLGANFEVAIGRPYFISLGISYKISHKNASISVIK